jgi:dephospho-CoA kinase
MSKHGPIRVLGIAGGIGSGKSEVARAFERLGALVVDSDVEARAALERPDVQAQLVAWWGPGVLKRGGGVDRKAIADIVFKDEAERRKLEGLIHPLVRSQRAVLVREAAARGARLAVIDAPLLFEAGVDRECDAVVFVDAPRATRLRRVRDRGWNEAEFSRREASQMPLEEKRRRSQYTISNSGGLEELEEQVRRVFRDLAGRE